MPTSRLRLLTPCLLLALLACAAPPPPSATALAAAPKAMPTAAPTTSAAPVVGPSARERIAAWEQAAPKLERSERYVHERLGAFEAVRCKSTLGSCVGSAIATSAGVIAHISWDQLVSAAQDIDGDGRADLIALAPSLGDLPDWHQVVVIADRPEGPVEIPLRGAEPGDWATAELTDSPARTLTVRKRGSGFERQAFTWDGQALVSKEVVLLRWSSNTAPGVPGTNWFLSAIAGGKTRNDTFERVAGKFEISPAGGLLDLRGDGERYYMVRFTVYPFPGLGGPNETSQLLLELRRDGWANISAPLFQPSTRGDRDKDGLPEYKCTLQEIDLAACTASSPDCDTSSYEPSALVGWDGQSLSANASTLKSIYTLWLKDALDEVAGFKGVSMAASCPRDRVDAVSRLYLARRWSGVDVAAAEAEVNAAMNRTSFAACAGPGGRGRPWTAIWKNLKSSLSAASPASP